jgi:hypothetical protein
MRVRETGVPLGRTKTGTYVRVREPTREGISLDEDENAAGSLAGHRRSKTNWL